MAGPAPILQSQTRPARTPMEITQTPTRSPGRGDSFFHSGWSRLTDADTRRTIGIDPISYELGDEAGYVRGLRDGQASAQDAALQEGLEAGIEVGRDEMMGELTDHFFDALRRAFEESELVFLEARRDFSLSPQTIYLRRLDGLAFEALFPIPEAEFASDQMLGLLDQAGEREEEFESEPFSVAFRFLPLGADTRDDLIYGEGFEFTYTRGARPEAGE